MKKPVEPHYWMVDKHKYTYYLQISQTYESSLSLLHIVVALHQECGSPSRNIPTYACNQISHLIDMLCAVDLIPVSCDPSELGLYRAQDTINIQDTQTVKMIIDRRPDYVQVTGS